MKCERCSSDATKEVWFSRGVGDFIHLCPEHFDELKNNDVKHDAVFELRLSKYERNRKTNT